MKKIIFAVSVLLCTLLAVFATACDDPKPITNNIDAAAPILIQQPSDVVLRNGQSTQGLEVKAYVKDSGSLAYQWYSNTSDSNSGGSKVENANKSVFVPDTAGNGIVYYYCVVTNNNNSVGGKQTVETVSDAAMVKIFSEAETPRIIRQPQNTDYVFGAQDGAFPLKVEAAVSKGELSYQWYVSDESSYELAFAIENATSAEYVPEIDTRGAKYYYCDVINTDPTGSEYQTVSSRSKLVRISVDYEYDRFKFESIDDNTCKITGYTGESLRPFIPEVDAEGRKVVEIGPGVFAGKPIVEVTIPDTVEKLGWDNVGAAYGNPPDGVFYNCKSLRTINFNGHFKYLGDFSFSNCTAMETNIWQYCDQLEYMHKGVFQSVPSMPENLVIPATLTGAMKYWPFQKCTSIKTVTFAGEGVTKIDGGAFDGAASLESIIFPASVTSVGDCLKDCSSLKSVTFERSKGVNGNITSGNPFTGTYPDDMQIIIPADSYEAYKTSLGSYGRYVVEPPPVAHTLTITGATINGERTLNLYADDTLDANATVAIDDEASCLGWEFNGAYYENYAELAAGFKMLSVDATLRALHDSDFTVNFTPSCNINDRASSAAVTGTIEHVDVGAVKATRYAIGSGGSKYIRILNGQETHGAADGVNNICPISDTNQVCIMMTFINNSSTAVTLIYESEYWGIRGSVEVTLAANETKSALLVQSAASGKGSKDTAFHQMKVTSGGDAGYDITVYGMRVG